MILDEAQMSFDSPLDPGIRNAVETLVTAGVETFESCQGGIGHAYPVPTVRFHGNQAEGPRAFAVALNAALPVIELRRVWPVIDAELTGPYWELTFAEEAQGVTAFSKSSAHELFSSDEEMEAFVEDIYNARKRP